VARYVLLDEIQVTLLDESLAIEQIVRRDRTAERVVDAVQPALPQPGKIERCLTQRLARQRPGVHHRATDVLRLDAGDAFAEVGSLRRAFFSRRPHTDYDEIVGSAVDVIHWFVLTSREPDCDGH